MASNFSYDEFRSDSPILTASTLDIDDIMDDQTTLNSSAKKDEFNDRRRSSNMEKKRQSYGKQGRARNDDMETKAREELAPFRSRRKNTFNPNNAIANANSFDSRELQKKLKSQSNLSNKIEPNIKIVQESSHDQMIRKYIARERAKNKKSTFDLNDDQLDFPPLTRSNQLNTPDSSNMQHRSHLLLEHSTESPESRYQRFTISDLKKIHPDLSPASEATKMLEFINKIEKMNVGTQTELSHDKDGEDASIRFQNRRTTGKTEEFTIENLQRKLNSLWNLENQIRNHRVLSNDDCTSMQRLLNDYVDINRHFVNAAISKLRASVKRLPESRSYSIPEDLQIVIDMLNKRVDSIDDTLRACRREEDNYFSMMRYKTQTDEGLNWYDVREFFRPIQDSLNALEHLSSYISNSLDSTISLSDDTM